MRNAHPLAPFFLIVADHTLRLLSVEDPMTDDQPRQSAARRDQERGRCVVCGPGGPGIDQQVAECARDIGPRAHGRCRHARDDVTACVAGKLVQHQAALAAASSDRSPSSLG